MEALERRGKIAALLLVVLWSRCNTVFGQRNTTKMSYVCPPNFLRLGQSCYYFSTEEATWNNALFACQDRDSSLTVPARWEDRNLRNYLNSSGVAKKSRWIGGIYDNNVEAWRWGGELRRMHYQSFSKMKKMTPAELQWHCIAMMPELFYRWSPRSCLEPHYYICQTKLRKEPRSKIKDLRRQQRMGKINEISVPTISREVNDPMMVNDVTVNPVLNPKSYDLRPNSKSSLNPIRNHPKNYNYRPNELRKRSRPTAPRKLTRLFPGYKWNRRNPEASYRYNAAVLRSGRTGLSPQKVKAYLARLQHMRDRQLAKRRHALRDGDWLVNEPAHVLAKTHARTYTVENNISALHPKAIVEEFQILPPPPPPAPPAATTAKPNAI